MAQTLCPYSLLPLDSEPSNDEHILPVALGAPASFTVRAHAVENSKMNDVIDGPTVNDELVRFLAMTQGVVSRSGPVKATVGGTIEGSVAAVKTSFAQGALDLKFQQPVETDSDGRVTGVRGFGDDAKKMAAQIVANYARKGIVLQMEAAQTENSPTVHSKLVGDMTMIRRQMFKIGYLTTVRIFGDEAITGQSGEKFRAAIMAQNDHDLALCEITATVFQPLPFGFSASTAKSEHAIISAIIPGVGLATSVSLFGCFTLFAVMSSDGISAAPLTGKVIVISAPESKLISRSYAEALPSLYAEAFQD